MNPAAPITVAMAGPPVTKARARFGRGRTFTPEATRSFQHDFGWRAKAAMAGRKPLQCAVKVVARFDLAIPLSWRERKRADAITSTILPKGKPDIDNLTKAVLDSCNGIVFADDSQIVEIAASKRYGINPKTIITVTPLEEPR